MLDDDDVDDWDKRAVSGDGQFAIALAIFELALQVKRLGNADAATPMGALEAFGAHLGGKLDALTLALGDIAEAVKVRDD